MRERLEMARDAWAEAREEGQRGQNKVCSKSCAKLERTLNITRRGGFFWQVARA